MLLSSSEDMVLSHAPKFCTNIIPQLQNSNTMYGLHLPNCRTVVRQNVTRQATRHKTTRPQDARPQCVERRTAVRYHVRCQGGSTWVQDVKSQDSRAQDDMWMTPAGHRMMTSAVTQVGRRTMTSVMAQAGRRTEVQRTKVGRKSISDAPSSLKAMVLQRACELCSDGRWRRGAA
jgi:hypothetical protein